MTARTADGVVALGYDAGHRIKRETMFMRKFIAHHIRTAFVSTSALAIVIAGLNLGSPAEAPLPASSTAEVMTAAPLEVDLAHSTLNYRIRHLGVSYFFGRINMPEGTFLLDPNDPANSHVNISAEIKNMDAGNDGRNKFLTGIDFFNAMEFPKTEFKSTSVKQLDKTTWEATGDFTLHGVTKPITVKLEEYAETQTSRFGFRAGFFVAFTIKRSDYGMSNFMDENMLGDEVLIYAGIEGARE